MSTVCLDMPLRPPCPPMAHRPELRARCVAERTWVVEGAVGVPARGVLTSVIGSAFIGTGAGVLVVNTGPSQRYGQQQRELIAQTTVEPVRQVLNLNAHPDHASGNAAWQDMQPRVLCEGVPGLQSLGQHRLEHLSLGGPTGDDRVLIDHSTGVAFVGALVCAHSVPPTPSAPFELWLDGLQRLESLFNAGCFRWVVPTHGPAHEGLEGLAQTRDWIEWVTRHMRDHAQAGRGLHELEAQPAPHRFSGWAAQPAELRRTLARWYPKYVARTANRR